MSGSNGVARLTRHPIDPDVVLINTPPALNSELGRFEPARFAIEHRAFVMHGDHVASFYRFARTVGLHVIDERRSEGARTQPAECANCGQPGSVGNPPKVCPACGETWTSIPPPVRVVGGTVAECGRCRHKQNGRFLFCAECGGRMDYGEPPPRRERHPSVMPPEPRPKLDDPRPWGLELERLRSYAEASNATRQAVTVPPHDPRTFMGRPVDSVTLPEPEPKPEAEPEEVDGW